MNTLNVLYVIIIRFIIFHIQNMNEWGTVEQHWYCDRCGFMVEQAYSIPFECFSDRKKGFKDCKGIYHAKNVKKHKRARRKCNYDKKIEINPTWSMYV